MADSKADSDYIEEARERYTESSDAWSEVRDASLEDRKFSRLSDQWPEEVLSSRLREAKPALTINKMPAFIRQIVNDARQNKPSINVRPVDNIADPRTAEIMNGLIRHIEATSDADVAYDTAVECAVDGGFGFFALDIDYARDDTFDLDIRFRRIGNPFAILWDARSEMCDSSDWHYAFEIESMDRNAFERKYPGAHAGEFTDDDKVDPWFSENLVRVAAYWDRFEIDREVLLLSNQDVVDAREYEKLRGTLYDPLGITVENQRTVASWGVKHTLMTGAESLETTDWVGQYIPIVPVYGEEVNVEGRRYFKSLISDSKDAQRMYNYWRSAATELVALAPKAPWIAAEGSTVNPEEWASANTENYAVLYYKEGMVPPQRQAFDASPVGSMQQALTAADDMKDIMGMHDASLGMRSNETSGRAIMARQREGDVSTFHFIDNLSRAIKCGGRILLDLIPKVYNTKRVIRILGEDEKADQAQIDVLPDGTLLQEPQIDGSLVDTYDLTKGKYDLVVKVGPSYTSKREEAATQMFEMGRVAPQFFEIAGDLLARNLDWPGADQIADRLEKLLPPGLIEQEQDPNAPPAPPQPSPEEMAMQAQMQAMQAKTQAEIQQDQAKAMAEAQTKREVAMFEAETKVMIEQNTAQSGLPADLELLKHTDRIAVEREKIAAENMRHTQSLEAEAELKLALKAMDTADDMRTPLMGAALDDIADTIEGADADVETTTIITNGLDDAMPIEYVDETETVPL
jgi:hypothetical protein